MVEPIPPDVAARIAAERSRRDHLKQAYPALYAAIVQVLFEEDPAGVNYETNTDEYEPEAGTIIPRLETCTSVVDVRRVLHEEFRAWFTPEGAGPEERYHRAAERIWELWRRYTPR